MILLLLVSIFLLTGLNPLSDKEKEEYWGTFKGSLQKGKFVFVLWDIMIFIGVLMDIKDNGDIADCMVGTNGSIK